jgi:hypothetical protein
MEIHSLSWNTCYGLPCWNLNTCQRKEQTIAVESVVKKKRMLYEEDVKPSDEVSQVKPKEEKKRAFKDTNPALALKKTS